MAPKKRLGVGAGCTVSLRFLHPKDTIGEKTQPNQGTEAFCAGGSRKSGETHLAQGNAVCCVQT